MHDLPDPFVELMKSLGGEHDLVVRIGGPAHEEGWVDRSLQRVERKRRVDRYAAEGHGSGGGTGEDRNGRVGPDETVVGEECRGLGFAVGLVVGIPDENVPVPPLLARAVDQVPETGRDVSAAVTAMTASTTDIMAVATGAAPLPRLRSSPKRTPITAAGGSAV